MFIFLNIVGGLVLLTMGGEGLVRGAVSIAERLKLPKMVIGIVLVGFGTSLPELVTSLQAALAGSPDIAIGNVVGSNIANILLIMGAAAMIAPVVSSKKEFRRDGYMLLGLSAMAIAFFMEGQITRYDGVIMLGVLGIYLWFSFKTAKEGHVHGLEEEIEGPKNLPLSLLFTFGGIALTVAGAKFLIDGSVELARIFGISEAVIGLTIVAFGTSLPELAASVVAALRGHSDVSVGNIIGSNVFNLFFIVGATSLVIPLPVSAQIISFDIWVMMAVTVLMVAIMMGMNYRLTRPVGIVFLALYAAYTAHLYLNTGM